MSPDPRHNSQDAYEAFMSMPQPEWLGLIGSLAGGGVLTPAEQEGFDRAVKDRPRPGETVLLEIEVTDEEAAALRRWHTFAVDASDRRTLTEIVDIIGLVERLAEAAAS